MTTVFTVQHSRGGAGATAVALTLSNNLSQLGRTLYVELDFLNPVLEDLLTPPKLPVKFSNDWIIGETSLEEAAVDVSSVFGLEEQNLYFMYANKSDGARTRMQVLDATQEKRIFKTVEKVQWRVGEDLDYVVIDTPPWMRSVVAAASYASDYVVSVLRPSNYELNILKYRMETVYSHFVCTLKPVINMFDEKNEGLKRFEVKLKETYGGDYIKIPYISDLAAGLDLSHIFSKTNPLLVYTQQLLQMIFPQYARAQV
ncbi:MAG: ParA family protein [Candidatus Caldarchaeum sp.]|nr:ParA family protein [Candidatus Caldarchaeum sp.]MDW7977285.1 ParA family protein [Candidatus Caldarchaeum sp.]